HVAVDDRTRAARVVTSHATDSALSAGGHVDRKPQAMRFEPGIEPIEHDPWFYSDGTGSGVEGDDVIQPLAVIDDQRRTHCLAALAGTGSARQHWHVLVPSDVQCTQQIRLVTRNHYTDGHDLIDRCVSCISAPACPIEPHLAPQLTAQEGRKRHSHHGAPASGRDALVKRGWLTSGAKRLSGRIRSARMTPMAINSMLPMKGNSQLPKRSIT